MNKKPFDNPKVREAMSMAIDRQTIIDTINAGSGQTADAIIAPAVFGYYSTGVKEYNPTKAKELLAEAGYPNGFSTTLWVNDNQSRIEMCQAMQAMLLEVGVQCNLEVLEFGSFISRTTAGDHDLAYFGWTPPVEMLITHTILLNTQLSRVLQVTEASLQIRMLIS